jgi:hypothetical protein
MCPCCGKDTLRAAKKERLEAAESGLAFGSRNAMSIMKKAISAVLQICIVWCERKPGKKSSNDFYANNSNIAAKT